MTDGSQSEAREERWRRLVEVVRGALGGIRASVETLELHPGLDAARRARLLAGIREQSESLERQLEELDAAARRDAASARSPLPAPELLRRLRTAIAGATGGSPDDAVGEVVDDATATAVETLVLDLDAEALIAGVRRVAERLRLDFGIDRLRLRLRHERGFGMLDLVWAAQAGEVPHLTAWQGEALDAGGAESLRAVARRGGGEVWLAADRSRPEVYLRVLLPVAEPEVVLGVDA